MVFPPQGQHILSNKEFGYFGSASFTPDAPSIVAKLIYQYRMSPSLCEFQIIEKKSGSYWIIPSCTGNAFDRVGYAIMNSTESHVNIDINPYKNGSMAAPTYSFTSQPYEKRVELLNTGIPDLNTTSIDTIKITCSSNIGAPLGIAGNTNQDRHVFYNGFRLFDNFYSISFSDIAMADLSIENIYGSDDSSNQMDDGAIVVYQTNKGRYGKMVVVKHCYSIVIMWETYESDGSVFSSGSELRITSTSSCDLDAGEKVNFEYESKDFSWDSIYNSDYYLYLFNGALFAVWNP